MNNDWRFVRSMLGVLLVFASMFLLAGAVYAFSSLKYIGTSPSTNTITVSGHGDSFAKPDIAEVTFSVEKTAATVAAAQKLVTDQMNDVLATLKSSGIADKDLQTTSYDIYPKYEYQTVKCLAADCYPQSNQKLVGYTVSNSVRVKIRDLDKAGDVLASLGQKNVTNLSGLNFTLEDDNAPKNEARSEAIAKAQDQANLLAKQLGVKLVRITNFSENANYPMYYKALGAADSRVANQSLSVAPTIQTGENKITSDVSITYEIK